jgi:hypothetical protein
MRAEIAVSARTIKREEIGSKGNFKRYVYL